MKIGTLVRFNHERDGGPVHRVESVMADGMIEIHDVGGYFAPHLFVIADDVADIPPDLKVATAGALVDVQAECERQVSVEGWTPEHDDTHREGELAMAAITYGMPEWFNEWLVNNDIKTWPFEGEPNFKNRRRDLVRAAALLIKEIERFDRAVMREDQ